MVRIKSASDIDGKYRAAIGRVPGAYKDAVAKVTGWQAAAIEGEELWKARIAEAAAAGRRAKALTAVSDEEWKRKAGTLGAERIGRGMTENADKRTRNYEPYRTTIEATELPARVADPMANVDNRVKGIVKALVDKKREIKG